MPDRGQFAQKRILLLPTKIPTHDRISPLNTTIRHTYSVGLKTKKPMLTTTKRIEPGFPPCSQDNHSFTL